MTNSSYRDGADRAITFKEAVTDLDALLARCGLIVDGYIIAREVADATYRLMGAVERAMRAQPPPASDPPPGGRASSGLLDQAVAIARSASGDVDWSREPLTKREREIRRRWLAAKLEDPLERASLLLRAFDYRFGKQTMASDLAAAVREATVLADIERAQDDVAEYEAIAELIDDEAA